MNKLTLRRAGVRILMAGFVLVFSIAPLSAWDMATHAYIEEHLYKKSGKVDSGILNNRIYGSGAMDLFNNNFSFEYWAASEYLHDPMEENFLKVWNIAQNKNEKAFAYGLVGHNNSWGMDSTAHIDGLTFGKGEGYVIAKAQILASMLGPALEAYLGEPLPEEVLIDLSHYLVESGVDFLVRAKDPAIGDKLMAAANMRSSEVPGLLAEAFKGDFASLFMGDEDAAEAFIETAEGNFRTTMWVYGYALTQENALDLVAGGLAEVGLVYLGLPSDPYLDALKSVAHDGILAAMVLCEPDFERELKATTGWLNGRLSSNKIVW